LLIQDACLFYLLKKPAFFKSQQFRTHATTVGDKEKAPRLAELRKKLREEDAEIEEFVNPGFTKKLTHTEALELRETVVQGTKVKTTKLYVINS
jgi:lipoic acid synthetase